MTTHIKTIILVLGVMLGIVVGETSSYASEIAVFGLVLLFLQLVVRKFEKKGDAPHGSSPYSVALFTVLFSLGLVVGIVRVQLSKEKMTFICEDVCTISAKIVSSPEIKNDYQVFTIHPVDEPDTMLDIQVRSPLYPRYTIGDTITVTGKVSIPKVQFPHNDTITQKIFDYRSYLMSNHIGSEMLYPKIELRDDDAHTVREYLGRWKEELITRSDTYVRSPASMLASGMLFGESSMTNELRDAFRTAGLSHIIVLSGFNIAIVITAILFVLSFVPLLIRIAMAVLAVTLFVMMVGAEPSVVRATIMAFIGLLAMVTGREYVARQALILSFLCIILFVPEEVLHGVSLHLSFLATAGIVYLSGPISTIIENYFGNISRASLKELFVTTVSAYLATLPYVMYTFGTVSLYALLANVIVLPLVPITMLLSFIVVLFSYVSNGLSLLFGFLDTVIINCMIATARIIGELPYASIRIDVSLGTMTILYTGIIFTIIYLVKRNTKVTHYRDSDGNLTDVLTF